MSEDVAWLAGFYCGEGCCYLRKRKSRNGLRQYVNLTFKIGQSDREPLDRVMAILGFGHVNGPFDKSKTSHAKKPHYVYSADGTVQIKEALRMMWPHLTTEKKNQAQKAIDGADEGWIGIEGRLYPNGRFEPHLHLEHIDGRFVSRARSQIIRADRAANGQQPAVKGPPIPENSR